MEVSNFSLPSARSLAGDSQQGDGVLEFSEHTAEVKAERSSSASEKRNKMPKTPVIPSAVSLQTVNQVLESVLLLSPPEQLLLYLKLPTGQPAADPLKSPVNPLGSRFEITQTINWIRTHFVEDKNVSIPKKNIYTEYLDYCSLNCMKPLSTADFGKVMKQIFPEVRPRRLGTRGNSRYCYSGLGKSKSLSSPYLPELLCEESIDIKGESRKEPSNVCKLAEEKLEKHLNLVSEAEAFVDCGIDSSQNETPHESPFSSKITEVPEVTKVQASISPLTSKISPESRKRRKGPGPQKKQNGETKKRKQKTASTKLRGFEESVSSSVKNENRTSICDIEPFSPLIDKSLTNSYNKRDLDISSDLTRGKPNEPCSKINRSYSVELPTHNTRRMAAHALSVDLSSDYDTSCKNVETANKPVNENIACTNNPSNITENTNIKLEVLTSFTSTINSSKNKLCSNALLDPNHFPTSISRTPENKLPLPRFRPLRLNSASNSMTGPIIILPPNVTPTQQPRQYKPIQPRPEKDCVNQNANIVGKLARPNSKIKKKMNVPDDHTDKDLCLNYSDSLKKLGFLGKDALDTYLSGEGNSQELDEELLQYFKADFSSNLGTQEIQNQILQTGCDNLSSNEKNSYSNPNCFSKTTPVNKNKISVSCKSSVPFYQSMSTNGINQPTKRCFTEVRTTSGLEPPLPSPSNSLIFKRQASFDSGVRDLETPQNIPPSPNTRCKLFNFMPISPRPFSPMNGVRDSSKSSCDTSIQSPFISPRNTPICSRTPYTVQSDSQQPSNMLTNAMVQVSQSLNGGQSKQSIRLRSVSTNCRSNSLIGNFSPVTRKTQDLPSFQDLVKMSRLSAESNLPRIKTEPTDHVKQLLPPISPLTTPDSPVFSFSEVRKDSPSAEETKLPAIVTTSEDPLEILNNDFLSQEAGQLFSKDSYFNFDFNKVANRSKSVPLKEHVSKSLLLPSSKHSQDTSSNTSIGHTSNAIQVSNGKPLFSNNDRNLTITNPNDDNLDKMLTFFKEETDSNKADKIFLDILPSESAFNSGDSIPLSNENDPIVSSCTSNSIGEHFSSRRDLSLLQSLLQSEQMPGSLDCLLGEVDIGLNGLCGDSIDVFSQTSLPSMSTD